MNFLCSSQTIQFAFVREIREELRTAIFRGEALEAVACVLGYWILYDELIPINRYTGSAIQIDLKGVYAYT